MSVGDYDALKDYDAFETSEALPIDTVTDPRRLESSASLLREPQTWHCCSVIASVVSSHNPLLM